MTFPKVLERNETGLSEVLRPSKLNICGPLDATIAEEGSPIRTQIANRGVIDLVHLKDESENNEDQKSPGYPNGPIAIYDDNVYLYLEPTAEEASKFDLVINVAREVNNPFTVTKTTTYGAAGLAKEDEDVKMEMLLPAEAKPADDSPYPDTALTDASFKTAFEFPPPCADENMGDITPTTPKAITALLPPPQPQQPEYIHMPWDHNTDISVDLMSLCERIEKTTKEGKKVLVHCQQGASRSASLIIAYGIYKNPELSVNDAYYAAQSKSRWISPNMRLMYCLQDFHKEMTSKKRLSPGSALRQRSGRSPTKHRLTLSADAIDLSAASATKTPLTAPLPGEDDEDDALSPGKCGSARQRGNSTPGSGNQAISPGPSSAPSTFSWNQPEDEKDPGKPGRFNFDDVILPHPPAPLGPPPAPPKIEEPRVVQTEFNLRPLDISKPPPTPGFGGFGGFGGGFAPRSFDSHGTFGFSGLSFQRPLDDRWKLEEEEGQHQQQQVPRQREITISVPFIDDTALMSPRAEAMTNNPLRDPVMHFGSSLGGMRFVESPPTPTEGLFSPRQTMFPRDPFAPFGRPPQVADPRSPPTKGETPIVRSIDEIL